MSTLEGNTDGHRGIHIYDFKPNQLQNDLIETVNHYKADGYSSIWLYLKVEHASLIHIPLQIGFKMHHCIDETIALNKWLLEIENKVPPFGTHHIGVAGVVMNKEDEILLVLEKSGPRKGQLSLPMGSGEKGEMISETVCREIKEETNIETEFCGILGMREVKTLRYGLGEMFFVCLTKMKSFDQEIILDETEIEDYKWLSKDKFIEYKNSEVGMNLPTTHKITFDIILKYWETGNIPFERVGEWTKENLDKKIKFQFFSKI